MLPNQLRSLTDGIGPRLLSQPHEPIARLNGVQGLVHVVKFGAGGALLERILHAGFRNLKHESLQPFDHALPRWVVTILAL